MLLRENSALKPYAPLVWRLRRSVVVPISMVQFLMGGLCAWTQLIAESSEGLVRRREDSGGDGDSGGNGDSGGDGDSTPEVDAKLWGKPGVALQSCWSQHLPSESHPTVSLAI